jgi:tetratricopeptide (TPR) repeat protein
VAPALLFLAAAGASVSITARAEPLVPTRDDEVVETLPGDARQRAADRRARQSLAARPTDAAVALQTATRQLALARATGDPRPAGLALSALSGFTDDKAAPAAVLVLRATLLQHLHDFDGAAETLERLLARPGDARDSQGWLTLATIRRVQGRYAASDAACRRLADVAPERPHGPACLAENAALRGETAAARSALQRLLAAAQASPGTVAWLTTTLAELEQRDGQVAASERHWRKAVAADDGLYARIGYADFLLERNRPAEARAALATAPRTTPSCSAWPSPRPGCVRRKRSVTWPNSASGWCRSTSDPMPPAPTGRERALFALDVEGDPRSALAWARRNATLQREPLDLLVFARAARAAGDAAALDEVRRLRRETALHDRRLDAALG